MLRLQTGTSRSLVFSLDTLTVIDFITVFSIIAFQKALHSAHLQLSRV